MNTVTNIATLSQAVTAITRQELVPAVAMPAYYRTLSTDQLVRARQQQLKYEAGFRHAGNIASADTFLHHIEWINAVLSTRPGPNADECRAENGFDA